MSDDSNRRRETARAVVETWLQMCGEPLPSITFAQSETLQGLIAMVIWDAPATLLNVETKEPEL